MQHDYTFDDLRAGFELTEGAALCHETTLGTASICSRSF